MIGTLTNDYVFRTTHNHDFHNQVAVPLMGPMWRHIHRAQKAGGILFPNFRPAITYDLCCYVWHIPTRERTNKKKWLRNEKKMKLKFRKKNTGEKKRAGWVGKRQFQQLKTSWWTGVTLYSLVTSTDWPRQLNGWSGIARGPWFYPRFCLTGQPGFVIMKSLWWRPLSQGWNTRGSTLWLNATELFNSNSETH